MSTYSGGPRNTYALGTELVYGDIYVIAAKSNPVKAHQIL